MLVQKQTNKETNMIEINHNCDANAKKNFMTAMFSLSDSHDIIIGDVKMTKRFNNRMSKEKQQAVRAYLREHAGKSFKVVHNSTIELVFRADKSVVEITFKQSKS